VGIGPEIPQKFSELASRIGGAQADGKILPAWAVRGLTRFGEYMSSRQQPYHEPPTLEAESLDLCQNRHENGLGPMPENLPNRMEAPPRLGRRFA